MEDEPNKNEDTEPRRFSEILDSNLGMLASDTSEAIKPRQLSRKRTDLQHEVAALEEEHGELLDEPQAGKDALLDEHIRRTQASAVAARADLHELPRDNPNT